jgi:hypothetical protein
MAAEVLSFSSATSGAKIATLTAFQDLTTDERDLVADLVDVTFAAPTTGRAAPRAPNTPCCSRSNIASAPISDRGTTA